MNINAITVSGFRNVNNASITFSDITALVSLNSYGKSNVISAIDFAFDFIHNSSSIRKRMMSWKKAIPLNISMDNMDFYFEIEGDCTITGVDSIYKYGFVFRWAKKNGTGQKIIKEWLKAKPCDSTGKFTNYIDRTETKRHMRPSETGRCSIPIKVNNEDLILDKLFARSEEYYFDLINQIATTTMCVERHLDANPLFGFNPLIRKGANTFDYDDNLNIPRALHHMKDEYPEKYELLKYSFISLFPNIRDVDVVEFRSETQIQASNLDDVPYLIDNKVYRLTIRDDNINQLLDFEDMSDGAKRVFLILVSIIFSDINHNSIIAIEEPENSVHPGLLQQYLQLITSLSSNCRILVTSHSPYIIQYLDVTSIYIGIPRRDGIASFAKVRDISKNQLLKDASKYASSTGDYIFDLLSGTSDEFAILSKYLEVKDNE